MPSGIKFFNVFTALLLFCTPCAFSQNPNFHIYLCFGQSNMEGHGEIEEEDYGVSRRFKVLQAVDCNDENMTRKKGKWYKAEPPLCRCNTHLSPVDYFGRTMVEGLPDSIEIGVINVAVGGCDIRLFDKDIYHKYDSTYTGHWFQYILHQYGNNPYEHMVSLAKTAQKKGVIKGILLHQGETNTGDTKWPLYVKKIYNDLLLDLSLEEETTPLLAGELVNEDQNGRCAKMNKVINTLPDTMRNAHVISSAGCQDKDDNVHFHAAGYRELGKRYGLTMLSQLNKDSSSSYVYSPEKKVEGKLITARRLQRYLKAKAYDKAIGLFSFEHRKKLIKQSRKKSVFKAWVSAWTMDEESFKRYEKKILAGGCPLFIFEGGEWKIDEK